MKRRQAILGIVLLAAGASRTQAQQARKVPRVGVLHPGTSKEAASLQREPFERGLRELGWVPGSTVLIDYRYAEGNAARLSDLSVDLIRSGVDVIVARSPAAIRAVRLATATIPIVMSAGDEEHLTLEGLVKNLSRPGGNITGIAVFDLDGKRLEMLKEAFPAASRVAILTNPSFDGDRYEARIAGLQAIARSLNLHIEMFEVTRSDRLAPALASIGQAKADALFVRGDPQVLDPRRAEIVAMAAKLRLPAMYWWRFFPEAGGLMSYGPSISAFHHRAATYVSRILKGANAGDLAIERPTKFDLVVNLKTAKALGVEISKTVLFRADEVIQ